MAPVDISFIHSELVDREEVARVCATTLPVRKSKYSHLAEKAVSEFQQRWQEEIGFTYCGGRSPKGPVTAFFPPESKQDRVEVFTKLIEYFFAHDGQLLLIRLLSLLFPPSPRSLEMCSELPEVLRRSWMGHPQRHDQQCPNQRNETHSVRSFLRLVEIDRKRGNLILRAIKNLSQVHETIGSRGLKTWDDLVQYRVQDFGAELNLMSIIYCCELNLTQRDIDTLEEVWWPATAAAALVNDLYSFSKEVILELGTDTDTTITTPNSIWYLMRTLNLTVFQAKAFLIDKIAQLEKDFIARKSEYLAKMDSMTSRTDDVRYFLEVVGLGLSGNCQMNSFRFNVANRETDHLAEQVLQQPIHYLRSVPSKNIRGTIIQALNLWLNAPESAAAQVEDLIGHLHESSLLLDDIQDSSELRRGRPTAYRVFGVPQTINAATHALTLAFEKVVPLMKPDSSHLFFNELRNLHVGQAMDLYWARSGYRPSIAEYLEMNRLKTGALFCLASNLLSYQGSFSTGTIKQTDLNDLMIVLGQYFQARDDYINLASTKYQEQKGFAQDLDEGKLSLPLIHLLTQSPNAALIENIQQERARNNKLPADLKQLILNEMRDQKILQLTEETLKGLEAKVYRHLERLEVSAGIKNFTFRFLLDRLREM
ncbi:terpenoid synthase [Aspergillus eucalypticola CBS 122712]|uniref:Terpenoid synthase n=1 Tax=Aspergillus eucalypticola (strain CBS 122712 / IBT 29274) TaxID=1448314 RepID=A0A317V252_ASPEC|nr:terpenoid synthase [Aspergillus eucalypticola CBS 122712]PWY66887.1 terpenoid synthase [Aspergillus eucalypticola CBS 122712]